MSSWLIGLVGVVYVVVAINLYSKGQMGMAIAFVGYALGNLGLLLTSLAK